MSYKSTEAQPGMGEWIATKWRVNCDADSASEDSTESGHNALPLNFINLWYGRYS
jgi:hypothetical protein